MATHRTTEMSASGYVLLPARGVIALRGADARPFLQGLISSDVEKISPEQAGYGALLTPQGKFLFDFMIAEQAGALLLETERERLEQLLRRLMLYKLRAKVELEDARARYAVAALLGEGVAAKVGLADRAGACRSLAEGLLFVDPRLPQLGIRALLSPDLIAATLEAEDFAPLEYAAYERARIRLGVPDGSRDLVVEKSTLLESGFEELNGVDFAKGCFVGQELTARMKYRGLVRKRLMPVILKGASPELGTIIRRGQREAGEMRSSINGQGLALLRLDQIPAAGENNTPLLAGETEVIPVKPDWARF